VYVHRRSPVPEATPTAAARRTGEAAVAAVRIAASAWGEAPADREIVEHALYAKDVDVALVWLSTSEKTNTE
jgi:hypothetical protein